MNESTTHPRRHAGALFAALCIGLAWTAGAQDISFYSIAEKDGIFSRELAGALQQAPSLEALPLLDCAVEYLRRKDGNDIVYRRGPIDLRQSGSHTSVPHDVLTGTEPSTEQELNAKSLFSGGMLLDLPRAGETTRSEARTEDELHYLLRVAVVPGTYRDNVLSARVILERALVRVQGLRVDIVQSEVFSRAVDIRGNDPLNVALPAWEAVAGDGMVIPASLEEAMLITLETPRYFAFPRNTPEPFAASTRLTYAVPVPCLIRLTIQLSDGEEVLAEGPREPGVYRAYWDAERSGDGTYAAIFTATDRNGTELHRERLPLVKSRDAASAELPRHPVYIADAQRFVASLESGVAFQLPADEVQSMRNMFTHIAARLGYRFSPSWEAGFVAGQDAFHELPGPRVDVERISDYGGVVPYTYGYLGPYLRWTPGSGTLQPVADAAVAFSNAATLASIGAGARVRLLPGADLTVIPTIMLHLKSDISAKLGLHYGISVRF